MLNDAPKIHQGSLQVDDHAITFPEIRLRMPLWTPHASAYANCEQSMLDWERNMVEKSDEMKIILTDIQHDESIASSMIIGSAETRYRGTLEREYDVMDIHPKYQKNLHDANEA
eukprot:5038287-Ditylum_brightwellii.AAC.1